MELATYIKLMSTASYLRGAAASVGEEWTEEMCVKAADEIEAALASDIPYQLRAAE